MNVAGYGRVSTIAQIEGTSLDEQRKRIKEKCKAEKFKLVDCYFDEGVSGGSRERPELERLYEDAKAGKFEAILFTKLDRLGRSSRDVLNLFYEFKELDIKLICIDEPAVNTQGKMGNVMLGIISTFAQLEHDTIRERTTGGRKAKWVNNEIPIGNHQLPLGYIKNKESKKIEIDDNQATIYKKIVHYYLDLRMSCKDIAIKLSEEGVDTPIAMKGIKKKSTSRWNSIEIGNILKDSAYKGEGFFNRYKYKHHPGRPKDSSMTSSKE